MSSAPKRRRLLRGALLGAAGLAVPLGLGIAGYLHRNATGLGKGLADVAAAGITEKQATVDGHVLNYAEGPRNGPPLLLVHGQATRWQDHMLVLPELATRHHVVAVDIPGHGGSDRLAPEEYTNARVGALLARFIAEVVGEPVILSGHSSGGLLALWIAAERPEWVRGLLLEDPPLFSSEMPRLPHTTGGIPLVLAERHRATGAPATEFQRYFVEHGNYFEFFGPLQGALRASALRWIDAHPGLPLHLGYLPPLVSVFFQGLVHYDTAFGAAWVHGEPGWYTGFDTEAALAAVDVPTTVIHTNYVEATRGAAYSDDGILLAAMDQADLDRAVRLLPDDTETTQLRSGHLVHFERPKEFLAAVDGLAGRVRARQGARWPGEA